MMTPPTPTQHRSEFAERLRIGRRARGFATAKEAAQILDVEQNTYTTWERGERAPDVWQLFKIKSLLGLPLDWLINGDASSLPASFIAKISKKQ